MSEPAPRTLPIARLVLAVVAVLGTTGAGAALGFPVALLFLAGCVLVGVIFLVWSSVQSLTGDTPLTLEEAIGLGAPSAEEERKRSVLRALKDLEFERSVGKISEEDYQELSARYRSEAKALLQALDKDLAPLRKKAERLLERRLEKEGVSAAASSAETATARAPAKEDEKESDSSPGPTAAALEPGSAARSCEKCGTTNDADASFCKRCGTTLVAEEQAV